MKHFPNLKFFSFIVLAMLFACTTIPYQDDVGFFVSAQANSPEFPVYVNGTICKDMDGNPGLCSKRIKTTDTIDIHFDAQDYAYQLTVACTDPIVVPGATVGVNQPYDLKLQPSDFSGKSSFVCIGEIFPTDRTQPLSAKFEVRIVVSDSNYVAREGITFEKKGDKNYVVLGQYARDAWVYDNSVWSHYSKKTEVEISDPSKVKAYSSSYSMRFNFLNVDVPVEVSQ